MLRGALQSHPRSRGERVTQERRDQKGTEVNEERLNRESGCDGRGRECRVSLLTAFASFTSRTARREGNRMMNVEREARQAKEGSKVGCISQPFTAPWFGCPLPAPVTVGRVFICSVSFGSLLTPYGHYAPQAAEEGGYDRRREARSVVEGQPRKRTTGGVT